MVQIGEEIEKVGEIFRSGTQEQSASPNNAEAKARLRIVHRIAQDLVEPIAELDRLTQQNTKSLYDSESGIRYLIEQVPRAIEEGEITVDDAHEFFNAIRELYANVRESLDSAEELAGSADEIGKLSREIRPVMRTLRRALTVYTEGWQVMQNWVSLIDATEEQLGPPL